MKDFRMKPTYDEIVRWMKEYFAAYNAYAQNTKTVHRMSDYFTENVRFVPYISAFGGPGIYQNGDFNFNGQVDFGDYLLLEASFGDSIFAESPAAVPEPGTLALLLAAAAVAFGGRRVRVRGLS